MRWIFFLLTTLSLFAEDLPLTTTQHTLQLGELILPYTATTGLCPIMIDGEKQAEIFFIAYTANETESRPITFVFPGGPGGAGTTSSIISFGPKRLLLADEGRTILPPYRLIDNPETILDLTDLVFVDPAGCGFSKLDKEANSAYFYSVEGDIETLSDFIYTYLDTAKAWGRPIYLAGNSYGTLRCCGLARNLFMEDIIVSGLILDGCAFEWSTIFPERDKPLAHCLLIPTLAATAWHHKRFWPEKPLEEIVDYARRFAYEEYAPFVLEPNRFNAVNKALFEEKFATLIGLPVEVVRRYNSRIDEQIYTSNFFGQERKRLGGLDTRYIGDIPTVDPESAHDPSYLDTFGFRSAFRSYVQKELQTYFPLTKYVGFSNEAFCKWHSSGSLQSSILQKLRKTLTLNPYMQVFIASGYYDCRTPFAATEYCFNHLDLPDSYRKNLHFAYYEAGHGLIFDHASLKKLRKDLTQFFKEEHTASNE